MAEQNLDDQASRQLSYLSVTDQMKQFDPDYTISSTQQEATNNLDYDDNQNNDHNLDYDHNDNDTTIVSSLTSNISTIVSIKEVIDVQRNRVDEETAALKKVVTRSQGLKFDFVELFTSEKDSMKCIASLYDVNGFKNGTRPANGAGCARWNFYCKYTDCTVKSYIQIHSWNLEYSVFSISVKHENHQASPTVGVHEKYRERIINLFQCHVNPTVILTSISADPYDDKLPTIKQLNSFINYSCRQAGIVKNELVSSS